MDENFNYEKSLTKYALKRMRYLPNITIYDDYNIENKVPIISFNIDRLNHGAVAMILSTEGGIGVRNGCFCAQPYVHKLLGISLEDIEKYLKNKNLPRPGMVRLSFGMYNDYEEIDIFLELLETICK